MRRFALTVSAVFASLCLAACGGGGAGNDNVNNNNQHQGFCGDGVLDPGEQCDQGELNSDQEPNVCRTNCRFAYCGDGVVDDNEECDSGARNGVSPDACMSDCMLTVCGDGYLGGDEVCDDGNTEDDDDCRSDCMQDMTLCGDGKLDPGEECDDAGNNSDSVPNACRKNCQVAHCGDDVTDDSEDCDNGLSNGVSSNPCLPDCTLTVCGDGYLGGDEVCDDGNTEDGDDCRGDCGQDMTLCGNGVLDPGEVCDDGNTGDGDGCSGLCQEEQGWVCQNEPSQCECAPYYHGSDCSLCVIFANREVTGAPANGHTWQSAFLTVQDGIDAAFAEGPGCEVWVAGGTYNIYQSSHLDTIIMRTGVAIYGGFAGNEIQREDRDPVTNVSLLDGRQEGNAANRVRIVVTAIDVEDAVLDGFTVSHGNNPGGYGGGMFVSGGGPAVTGCTFSGNTAYLGGGLYIYDGTPVVTGCTFSGNTAHSGGGGGMYIWSLSTPVVTGCTFSGNTAYSGGGLYIYDGTPVVIGCTFSGNTGRGGGGIFVLYGSPSVIGSMFSGNTANSGNGGGMYIWSRDTALISGCTFTGNTAHYAGGGMSIDGGGMSIDGSSHSITGCAFSGNTADRGGGLSLESSSTSVTGCTFSGNIAQMVGGGGMSIWHGNTTVTGCTIVANHSYAGGGGLYGGDVVITNGILWGNTADFEGHGIFPFGGYVTAVHSVLQESHALIQTHAVKYTDPIFVTPPGNTGAWTSVTYDPALLRTALFSEGASWTAGSHVGLFVQPNVAEPLWFPVAQISADTIWVEGDLTGVAQANDSFAMHSLVLDANSPCIDAGYGCSDPSGCTVTAGFDVPQTPATDITGAPLYDAGLNSANGGAGNPDYVDMGAYEWRP